MFEFSDAGFELRQVPEARLQSIQRVDDVRKALILLLTAGAGPHPDVEGPKRKDENPEFHGASGPGGDGHVVDKESVAGDRSTGRISLRRDSGMVTRPRSPRESKRLAEQPMLKGGRKRKLSLGETLENDAGFTVVGGAEPFAEAAFFGDAERREIFRVDQAHGAGIGEASVGPGQSGADRFRPVAFTVHPRREHPARFAKIFNRGLGLAEKMRDADFARESAGGFFFEHPKTKTEERPMPGVALEFQPGLFLRERAATDELSDARVAPHFAAGGKVFEAMAAEPQVGRFENGKFGVERKRLQGELLGKMEESLA